jgi:hypothetical protein
MGARGMARRAGCYVASGLAQPADMEGIVEVVAGVVAGVSL